MNHGLLLKHFEKISEAPDAVPRLRRFILDLAVRGKLVPQDPNDEPASEFLKRIEEEKNRIPQSRKGTRINLDHFDKDKAPFHIPASWEWSQLAHIGQINPKNEESDVNEASFVPMSMINAKYGQGHLHKIRTWAEIKNGFTHFAEGDVGLAKITPCFENGKSTVFRNLTNGIGAGTTELHIVRPIMVNAYYILVFLKSSHFREMGISKMTGTAGQKRVPRDYFAFSPFPLPPLAEQQRIVAKADELMKVCEELEAAQEKRERRRDRLVAVTLHRLNNGASGDEFRQNAGFFLSHLPKLTTRPEHVQQLRQTILNLAVRGKLVPQDPNDEPASDLLDRISVEQRDLVKLGRIKKRVISVGAKPGIGNHQIPKEWHWSPLADLISFGPQNGISPKPTNDEQAPKALTLTATTSGFFDPTRYKHVELSERECENYWLSEGDVLFQRGNTCEYVGMAAVFRGPQRSFVFPDLMIRVRFSELLNLRFVHTALISPPLRKFFAENATGTSSSMPKISQEVLLSAPIPVPPVFEQHRIVAKLEELMGVCAELEAQVDSIRVTRSRFLEATLHEALSKSAEN